MNYNQWYACLYLKIHTYSTSHYYVELPTVVSNVRLQVNDIDHSHVMRPDHVSELEDLYCSMCDGEILGSPYKCESCSFQTHNFCAELGKPSIQRRHCNHPWTLMPEPDARAVTKCDICKKK